MKLKKQEKMIIERTMESQILAKPGGINTRKLIEDVFNSVCGNIPNVNMHHIAGMLSWVYKKYNHNFLVRTPGYSVIV